MAYGEGSDLQLLELSREGARKLTRMFNSMPRMPNLDLEVEIIGNDLLKGALDLHESINELQKLQYLRTMSQRMDERKFELEGGKSEREEKLVRTKSWRNSKDELKKVIRESIYKQNLLPTASSADEKGLSSRSLGFRSSSNQFSVSSELEGRKSSNSTTTRAVKMRSPNLIARLMGLEDIPSEGTQSVPKKQTLSEIIEKEKSEMVLKQERAQPAKSVFYHIIANETQESLNKWKGETVQMNEGKLIMGVSLDARCKAATAVKLVLEPKIVSNSQQIQKEVGRIGVRNLEKGGIYSFQQKQRPPPDNLQRKKDAINPSKRANERQKPGLNMSISIKSIDAKATVTQISQAKSARTQLVKPEKAIVTAKNSLIAKAGFPTKLTAASQIKTKSADSSSQRRERKAGNIQAKRSTNNKPLKQDDNRSVYNSDKTDVTTAISKGSVSIQSKKKKEWAKSSITDNIRKDQKVIDAIMPQNSRVSGTCLADATIVELPKKEHRDGNAYRVEDLTSLLLSSKEIVFLARKLCSDDAQQIVCDEEEGASGFIKLPKLYLACAEELIARQSYHLELSNHLMWCSSGSRSSLTYASLDELVEAITKGINMLADYSKVDDDNSYCKDSLPVIWERDLQCNQMRWNSMWDSGWWNGIFELY